jgi:hypothetical protein
MLSIAAIILCLFSIEKARSENTFIARIIISAVFICSMGFLVLPLLFLRFAILPFAIRSNYFLGKFRSTLSLHSASLKPQSWLSWHTLCISLSRMFFSLKLPSQSRKADKKPTNSSAPICTGQMTCEGAASA